MGGQIGAASMPKLTQKPNAQLIWPGWSMDLTDGLMQGKTQRLWTPQQPDFCSSNGVGHQPDSSPSSSRDFSSSSSKDSSSSSSSKDFNSSNMVGHQPDSSPSSSKDFSSSSSKDSSSSSSKDFSSSNIVPAQSTLIVKSGHTIGLAM